MTRTWPARMETARGVPAGAASGRPAHEPGRSSWGRFLFHAAQPERRNACMAHVCPSTARMGAPPTACCHGMGAMSGGNPLSAADAAHALGQPRPARASGAFPVPSPRPSHISASSAFSGTVHAAGGCVGVGIGPGPLRPVEPSDRSHDDASVLIRESARR